MAGVVLIVDADSRRRDSLRNGLDLPAGEVVEIPDPAELDLHLARNPAELVLLDVGAAAGLEGLRRLRSARAPVAVIALTPPDRPDLRLAALDSGADDAADRNVSPRLLRARVRSLLRQRDDALSMAPPEGREMAWPGMAEAPADFASMARAAGFAGLAASALASDRDYGPEPRVALLDAWPGGARPPTESIARLLEATVVRIGAPADLWGGEAYDLALIDGAGTRGDLAQGSKVLALLAELQGRLRGGQTSTLVLLPESAVETAALALDLGANDVVAGPVAPREVALRAHALIARRRLREALRDQVRSGLRAAMIDPLTALHNRRYAEAALRRLSQAGATRAMALLLIDIDHFKTINDSNGHAAGDRVLVEVGRRLRMVLRPSDLLARVGGDEFMVALIEAGAEEAVAVADRLRRAVGERPFLLDSEPSPAVGAPGWVAPVEGGLARVRVTVSIGMAATSAPAADPGLVQLLRRADAALYEAKDAGRDGVHAA